MSAASSKTPRSESPAVPPTPTLAHRYSRKANSCGHDSAAACTADADHARRHLTESSFVMADSRIEGNVDSTLTQPVVDSSTTDVDASKPTTTTVSASSAELSSTSPKKIEHNNENDTTATAVESKSELSTKSEEGEGKGTESANTASPTTKEALDLKDSSHPTDTEHDGTRSGSASPTKVDRKTATKKHSFKPVSVTKQFLKETTPTASGASSPLGSSLKPQGTTGSPGLSSATVRPVTVSKLKLVRSSGGLQTSKTNGTGGTGSASSKNESQPVWNKNKAPTPVAQPPTNQMTDEELTRKFGIHLASRLGPEESSKEAKWADIEDDDEDWEPEALKWNDGMEVAPPADTKLTPSAENTLKPEPLPPKEVPHPVSTVSGTSTGNKTVLRPKSSLVTEKANSKGPEPVNAAPTPKSPWAKISVPVVPIQPPTKAGDGRREDSSHREAPPIRDVSAEGYDRSWRDRVGGQSNRELFNSQTGQMEPAPENRPRNMRPLRHEAPMSKPAVLQRRQSAHQPPEPSPAFQTHRTSRPDDYRRRTNSNMSGGSGGFRRPSFSRRSIDDEYGPTSVFDDDAPLPPRTHHGPHGGYSPGHPPTTFGHHQDISPRFKPVFPRRSMTPPVPLDPLPTQEPPQPSGASETADPVPSAVDIIEMQKRVMKESVEKARQRRLEEEARLEAEKKERLAAKLAELERKQKEKEEKEAAEKAEKERIAAEEKAAEEKRKAEEQEEAEKKRQEAEAATRAEQAPLGRAEAARDWRSPQPQMATHSRQHSQPPPPVWTSDRVRNVFSEGTRPSSSAAAPHGPSFPPSFSTDLQPPRHVPSSDPYINDSSRQPFLPPSEASSTSTAHTLNPVTQQHPSQPIYQHPSAPLHSAYHPQFTDMRTMPAQVRPGAPFSPAGRPTQPHQDLSRQHANQYGAIGDRTNREYNDRGQSNSAQQGFGRGQPNFIQHGNSIPHSLGRGQPIGVQQANTRLQGNQRFVGGGHQLNNGGNGNAHHFNNNFNDYRGNGNYSGFSVPPSDHNQGYRNHPGGRNAPSSPNLTTRLLTPPSGSHQGNGHPTYQTDRHGRRSPASNNEGALAKPNTASNVLDAKISTPNNDCPPTLKDDRISRPQDRGVNISAAAHRQNMKILADANIDGVSAWSAYNAQEDDAKRVKQASAANNQDTTSISSASAPASAELQTKQTIIYRHKHEVQTEAEMDADVAAWATRRGKNPVSIPEHLKPGYVPPPRSAGPPSLPPHLKAKMQMQETRVTELVAPPQSPPPPISDDHPVHGDHQARVHLPGQNHDHRTASWPERISSVQDKLLSVMSHTRPTFEARGEVTVALPPVEEESLCTMAGAEAFQEGLNHQPFGSTPTVRIPPLLGMNEPVVGLVSAIMAPSQQPSVQSRETWLLDERKPRLVIVNVPGGERKEVGWRGRGGREGGGRGGGAGAGSGGERGRGRGRKNWGRRGRGEQK